MIIDVLIGIVKGLLNILLAPLEVINIGIDFIASIPIVTSFLQVVAYILPWNNILPLIALVIVIFGFRIIIALVKTIEELIPFV